MAPLTKEEEYNHKKRKFCYICKKPFSADNKNKKYREVKDPCYYTGKYRGAAHGICNLRYNMPRAILRMITTL